MGSQEGATAALWQGPGCLVSSWEAEGGPSSRMMPAMRGHPCSHPQLALCMPRAYLLSKDRAKSGVSDTAFISGGKNPGWLELSTVQSQVAPHVLCAFETTSWGQLEGGNVLLEGGTGGTGRGQQVSKSLGV